MNSTGAAPVNESWATTAIVDETWYTMSVSWTPSSGTTGVLSGFTTGGSFATASYTLPATGTIGIGSANDRVILDNIQINVIPEPGSGMLFLFGGVGLGALWRKCRVDACLTKSAHHSSSACAAGTLECT